MEARFDQILNQIIAVGKLFNQTLLLLQLRLLGSIRWTGHLLGCCRRWRRQEAEAAHSAKEGIKSDGGGLRQRFDTELGGGSRSRFVESEPMEGAVEPRLALWARHPAAAFALPPEF
jgi:hypothetical protein